MTDPRERIDAEHDGGVRPGRGEPNVPHLAPEGFMPEPSGRAATIGGWSTESSSAASTPMGSPGSVSP